MASAPPPLLLLLASFVTLVAGLAPAPQVELSCG
eukprot:SAG31_NODE_30777_length_376_cov_0.761733_1_plen_33_part_10